MEIKQRVVMPYAYELLSKKATCECHIDKLAWIGLFS